MFSCNGNKCGNKTNITANNWTKCRCEIYSKEETTKHTKDGIKTTTEVKTLYKGTFGVFTRDYTIENGTFSGKAEIKVDVNPSQPLTAKFDISKHFSKLFIKIENTHTPRQFDTIQVKRYNPNGYKSSIILIGNLIYNA